MRAFRPEFVAVRATNFIGMIKDCDEAGFPKVRRAGEDSYRCNSGNVGIKSLLSFYLQHLLFGSLGRSLACADPPEPERLTILNEAWKVVTKVRSPQVTWEHSNVLHSWLTVQVLTARVTHVFRITSTVQRSGWSSPADTSQWVKDRRSYDALCYEEF